MSPADIVVLLLVAAALVCAVVHSLRAREKRGGCGCGCSGCTMAGKCAKGTREEEKHG